jgi:hypothetical protein
MESTTAIARSTPAPAKNTQPRAAGSCCSVEEKSSCCEPSEKSACCGTPKQESGGRCGCR